MRLKACAVVSPAEYIELNLCVLRRKVLIKKFIKQLRLLSSNVPNYRSTYECISSVISTQSSAEYYALQGDFA